MDEVVEVIVVECGFCWGGWRIGFRMGVFNWDYVVFEWMGRWDYEEVVGWKGEWVNLGLDCNEGKIWVLCV